MHDQSNTSTRREALPTPPATSPRRVYMETYGCQMNVLDTELVGGQLQQAGYAKASSMTDADVVLLNTCSVRELSEHKVWSQLGRLGQIKREKPNLVVGVLGCMAEREGTGIHKRMQHVDLICGPSNLDQLPALLEEVTGGPQQPSLGAGAAATAETVTPRPKCEPGPPSKLHLSLSGHTARRSQTLEAAQNSLEALDLSRAFSPTDGSPVQAYVRITRGCNKFCSFCVVPFTRGPEVHRPPQHIIDEVKGLVDQGVLEVTLLGQTINHYHYKKSGDTSTTFADLLWQLHEAVPELPRLRFLTSYPRDFTDEALDAMAAAPRICRYLHIPAQSGSNRMLRAMNRGYDVETYLELLERARARMPDIRLAGDMIAGFPTETGDDHNASLDLLRQARYKSCFVFKYSPRPNTVAVRRFEDDIPDDVKKTRHAQLLGLQSDISLAHHQAMIGSTVEVLVESESKLKQTPEVPVAKEGTVATQPLAAPPTATGGPLRPAASTNPHGVRIGWHQPAAQENREPLVRLVARTRGDEIVAFEGPRRLLHTITTVRCTGATGLTVFGRWSPES